MVTFLSYSGFKSSADYLSQRTNMPYFIYRITQAPAPMARKVDLIDSFDAYKEARSLARSIRTQLAPDDKTIIKLIFADNQLEAEQRLTEAREAPVLKEWEK